MTLARSFPDLPPSAPDDPKAKWPALERLIENNDTRKTVYSGHHLRIGPGAAYSLRLRMVLAIQKFCERRRSEGRALPLVHYGRPTFGPGDFENNAMVTLPSEQGPLRFLVVDPASGADDVGPRYVVYPESERDRHPGDVWDTQP
jgi:hypothetical protein